MKSSGSGLSNSNVLSVIILFGKSIPTNLLYFRIFNNLSVALLDAKYTRLYDSINDDKNSFFSSFVNSASDKAFNVCSYTLS